MKYSIIQILKNCALSKDRTTAVQMRLVVSVYTGQIKRLSRLERGNYGEILQYLVLIGSGFIAYHPRLTSLIAPSHHGIDGLYYMPHQRVYIVTDAKYGTSRLGRLKDGRRQLSDAWIDLRLCPSGSSVLERTSRLTSIVGERFSEVIIQNIQSGTWALRRLVVHISSFPNSDVSLCEVNSLGFVVSRNISL